VRELFGEPNRRRKHECEGDEMWKPAAPPVRAVGALGSLRVVSGGRSHVEMIGTEPVPV
jgi:hypothetical protein